MEKTLFEQIGGTYYQVGDYLLTNITVPEGKSEPISVWGQRHARYLIEHRKILYMNLLTSSKLNIHLGLIVETGTRIASSKQSQIRLLPASTQIQHVAFHMKKTPNLL